MSSPQAVTRARKSVRIPKKSAVHGNEHSIFLALIRGAGLPLPVAEFCHTKPLGRKHRLDYAWPDAKLGVECQGGTWSRGKHGRGSGIAKDMEKNNLGILLGWRVLQFTPQQLVHAETIEQISRCLTA